MRSCAYFFFNLSLMFTTNMVASHGECTQSELLIFFTTLRRRLCNHKVRALVKPLALPTSTAMKKKEKEEPAECRAPETVISILDSPLIAPRY